MLVLAKIASFALPVIGIVCDIVGGIADSYVQEKELEDKLSEVNAKIAALEDHIRNN